MITKAQLIRTLEPFTDEIEIVIASEGYQFVPEIFYVMSNDGEGMIVLGKSIDVKDRKAVELKIR